MNHPSVVFVAMKRPGQPSIVRPGGSHVFQEGDLFTIAGHQADLEQILDEVVSTSAVENQLVELAMAPV